MYEPTWYRYLDDGGRVRARRGAAPWGKIFRLALLVVFFLLALLAIWVVWLGLEKAGEQAVQTVDDVRVLPPGPTFVAAEPTSVSPVAVAPVPSITVSPSPTYVVVLPVLPTTVLSILSPTPTAPSYPTPESASLDEIYAAAFGSCAGRYHGRKARTRTAAARVTLERGLQTLDEMRVIIDTSCAGALELAAARLAPGATPTSVPNRLVGPSRGFEPLVTPRPSARPGPTSAPVVVVTRVAGAGNRVKVRPPSTRTPLGGELRPVRVGVSDHVKDIRDFQNWRWLSGENPGLAKRMASVSWVVDGLNPTESSVIEYLLHVATFDRQSAVERLIEMPFLRRVDVMDAKAVEGIWRVLAVDATQFDWLMRQPVIDDGITDEWTPVLATLRSAVKYDLSLMERLLDPSRVRVERVDVVLPLAGLVTVAVVRTSVGGSRSVETLEHAVRSAERFMGIAFPTGGVVLLFADAVSSGVAGENLGTHIVVGEKYDIDDGGHEAVSLHGVVAHEVAHYYWSGNSDWLDEGLADLMSSVSERDRIGRLVKVTNYPCAEHGSISELQAARLSKGDLGFDCNYSLGERMFFEMYLSHGDLPFRKRLQNVYRRSVADSERRSGRGTSVDIDDVRDLMGGTALADTVIDRWYDGGKFDTSLMDFSEPSGRLVALDAEVVSTGLVLDVGTEAVSDFLASEHSGLAYFMFEYRHEAETVHLEMSLLLVEYYEDGHEFRRRVVRVKRGSGSGAVYHSSVGPSGAWKPGRHWAMLFDGDDKVASSSWVVKR